MEIPVINNTTYKSNSRQAYRLVAVKNPKKSSEYRFYVAKILYHGKKKAVSLLNLKKFTGIVKIMASPQKTVFSKRFSKGKSLTSKTLTQEEYNALKFSKYVCEGCFMEKVYNVTVYYNNYTGEVLGVELNYIWYRQVCGGGSGGGGTGGGSSGDASTYVERTEEKIALSEMDEDLLVQIINELGGKTKCVFDKLKKTNLYESTIGVFDNNNDNYILTIKNGDCQGEAEACTDGSDIENGLVTIKIEHEGNRSLDLAAIILHEGIHAELFKYVHEHNTGIDPSNRAALLHYYFYYKSQVDPKLVDMYSQHQYMADNYVKPIARAIRELDNNSYPLEYYMGFGWDGLREYGWDKYYVDGKAITLSREDGAEYYEKQAIVMANTEFNNDCDQ